MSTVGEASPGKTGSRWLALASRHRRLLVLGGLILLPLVIAWEHYYLEILALIFLWSAMAGAWNIVGGYAGKFSLGHAAFFGLGAYTSSLLYVRLGITPWLGVLVGIGLSVLLALFVGMVTLRLKGKFFALCTIAIGEVLVILAVYFRGLTNGSEGLLITYRPGLANMIFEDKIVWVYIFMALMLAVYATSRWLEGSKLGYELAALREDEDAAEALGVNTLYGKLASFAISAAFTSLGGTLFAQYFQWLEPQYVLSLDLSIQFALYAIIGGMGTAIGPILGASLITPLQIFLRAFFGTAASGMYLIIYGLLLVVVVLFMPRGIAVEVGARYRHWREQRRAQAAGHEVRHAA